MNEGILKPQRGKQEQFLSSWADMVFYGGAAGAGKTYGLILEPLRWINCKNFKCITFRKELVEIKSPGGLWDAALEVYPYLPDKSVDVKNKMIKTKINYQDLSFSFPEFGSKISFSYSARDEELYKWQGSQMTLIQFDELTHFSKRQFFFFLSRNRNPSCKVQPYIRATTNPDPDSWVRKFVDWWIDKKGYAIEERSGVVRWFTHINDQIYWFDSKEEAKKRFPDVRLHFA